MVKRRSNHVLVFLDTGFYFVVGNELVSDHSPVLNLAAVPFFVELGDSEIEHFKVLSRIMRKKDCRICE